MNLSICKLPTQTQAAFWFMLFNWIKCNNYSITIGPERRKILADYYSRSNDPDSRAVQNIFRGLTKSGLFLIYNGCMDRENIINVTYSPYSSLWRVRRIFLCSGIIH